MRRLVIQRLVSQNVYVAIVTGAIGEFSANSMVEIS